MKLIDIITAANGRTSGGDPYLWTCFGENANFMEFRDVNGNGYSHCIFDTKTYQVYQVHVEVPLACTEIPQQSFQWTAPEFIQGFLFESKQHDVDPTIAYDDVVYRNILDEEEVLELVEDIGNCEYDHVPEPVASDGKVAVPLTLSQDEQFRLMQMAHEADMTLNQYVEMILQGEIDRRRDEESLSLDMPGTMGSAKLVFPNEVEVSRYTVKLDVQYTFDVDAKTSDEAIDKAKYFRETMPTGWGQGAGVSWVDTEIVQESVVRGTNV